MPLTFFADQRVPGSIVELLKSSGNTVIILKDHIPPASKDNEVIQKYSPAAGLKRQNKN